jgi:hypothetical protein
MSFLYHLIFLNLVQLPSYTIKKYIGVNHKLVILHNNLYDQYHRIIHICQMFYDFHQKLTNLKNILISSMNYRRILLIINNF